MSRIDCKPCGGSGFSDYRGFCVINCPWCAGKGTIERSSIVAPFPWLVTKKHSGGWRFLIDKKTKDDPAIYSGFYVSDHGDVNREPSLCSGNGGRHNYYESHFVEELPVRLSEIEVEEVFEWALQKCPEGVAGMPEVVAKVASVVKEYLTTESRISTAITLLYTYGVITESERDRARVRALKALQKD